jgi:hypothetical protein
VTTPMRLLVCGGRFYADKRALYAALDAVHSQRGISCIIHGACSLGGADALAGAWAHDRGIPVDPYPVDHTLDGPWPGAGPRRNQRMFDKSRPDGVCSLPGGRGTRSMCDIALKGGVKVWQPYLDVRAPTRRVGAVQARVNA